MSTRLGSWKVAVVFAFAMSGAGCNAILGNDQHELGQPDGGGAATGTGSGTGSAATVGTGSGGASTGSAGTGGTAGAGTGGAGSGSGGANGTGVGGTTGGSIGPDASDDAPGTVCTGNVKECQGRTLRQCSGGQWVDLLQCPYACVTDVCTGSCVPGTKQCSSNTPQTCDDKGQWVNGASCPGICSLGDCTGMCMPGTTQTCGSPATCNGGAIQTCDATGTWTDCTPAPSNCTAIPLGWQAVATTQAACPQGFGSPQTYFTKATGNPFTCQCGCSGTQKCAGTVTLNEFDPDDGGNCAGTPSTRTLSVTPTCGSGGGSVTMPHSYTISDIVYGPAPACTAAPKALTMPQVVTQSTILCTATTTCPGGACLSLVLRTVCIAHAGEVACPTEYPAATVMSSSYDDNRACSACTCGSTLSCTLTDVQLNNDSSGCTTGHPYWMNANNTTCTAAPATYPLNATKAIGSSTGDGACAATSTSDPSGTVKLNAAGTMTVCCR